MRKSSPKVSRLTFISTGSYTLAITVDNVLFGLDAIKIIKNILTNSRCTLCGKSIDIHNVGLVDLRDSKIFILCRDCLLDSINYIKNMIEILCC